jgi:hypothetical protein
MALCGIIRWEGEIVVFVAKDLEKHYKVYNTVMKEFQYFISHVQQIYLTLIHVKGGAIMSAPNAVTQIDGHHGKLHSNVLEHPSNGRQVSVIVVAVEPFKFMHLPSQDRQGNIFREYVLCHELYHCTQYMCTKNESRIEM